MAFVRTLPTAEEIAADPAGAAAYIEKLQQSKRNILGLWRGARRKNIDLWIQRHAAQERFSEYETQLAEARLLRCALHKRIEIMERTIDHQRATIDQQRAMIEMLRKHNSILINGHEDRARTSNEQRCCSGRL